MMLQLFLSLMSLWITGFLLSSNPVEEDVVESPFFAEDANEIVDSSENETWIEDSGTLKEVFLFSKFMKLYNKTYKYRSPEYFLRFENFKDTLRRRVGVLAADFGSESMTEPQPATFGLNQFSDLSVGEFRSLFLTLSLPKRMRAKLAIKRSKISIKLLRKQMKKLTIPMTWDWRDLNVVTAIKDQGHCGACYAVSTVEMIESMRSMKMKKLTEELSVQEVLDCASRSHGCQGGNPYVVLDWLNGTKFWMWPHKPSLAFEKDYPSLYIDQRCNRRLKRTGHIQIQDFFCHAYVDELEIIHQVFHHGPVTVAVDSTSWQDYLGGIVQHNCFYDINHAAVVVGFDLSGRIPYYIVRNSWGKRFGEAGYVYVRIGKNMCGISTQVCGAFVSG